MKSLALALALSVVSVAPVVAQSRPAPVGPAAYFPVDKITPGLKGHGLTIWQGDKMERFEVEVLGVLQGAPNPKQNLVIAKLSGGQVARTKVFAGMSGSPVYFDGRLAGAIAYSFPFSTEPIAGITPIGQMVDQLDGQIVPVAAPGSPVAFQDFVKSIKPASAAVPGTLEPGVTIKAAAANGPLAQFAGQTMVPIATPLAFGGVPQSVIDQVAPEFARAGILAVAGGAGGGVAAPMSPFGAETLMPGSSVVVQLIRGDFNAAAAGTVTDRQGDKIFAFGHPFLSLGSTEMPMAESDVIVVVPSVNNSFKLANATKFVGSIGQDRSSGIGGKLGQAARMIPHVDVTTSQGGVRDYDFEMINDASLTPMLANVGLLSAITGTERQTGDQTVSVRGRIKLAGHPDVLVENRFSSSSNAAGAATMSVAQPIAILMNSGFKDVRVESVDVDIIVNEERSLASLTRVWVDRTRAARGETVNLSVFARTEDGHELVRRVPITIPRDAPIGRIALLVGDGSTLAAGDEQLMNFVPENARQLVDAFNKLKKNDRLYVKLVRGAGGALVDNTPMAGLPPSVLGSLGSPRSTSGFTPLQSVTLADTELSPGREVVTGQQSIVLTVAR